MSSDEPNQRLERVGPYRLTDHLASGGSGQIHVAVKGNEGETLRQFAVKTVLPDHADRDKQELALLHEAQLGSQLLHPNIVAVHDYGRDGDLLYLVMDYVDGSDLRGILKNVRAQDARLPDNVAAWIISEVCEGLAFAHRLEDADGRALEIVHRDISPQNILVGKSGEVRIADFGVAHSAQEDRPETEAGVIKGKLRYMSPEYLLHSEQDHRGDIFAAGLVLFELLTNEPAYPRTDGLEVMLERISRGAVDDIRRHRPQLGKDLERIIAKALSPDPELRYGNADDMAADLKRFVWDNSSGLTRARVGELLGVMGSFGRDWTRPRAVEDSISLVTSMAVGPNWSKRSRLDDTAPIRATDLAAAAPKEVEEIENVTRIDAAELEELDDQPTERIVVEDSD